MNLEHVLPFFDWRKTFCGSKDLFGGFVSLQWIKCVLISHPLLSNSDTVSLYSCGHSVFAFL